MWWSASPTTSEQPADKLKTAELIADLPALPADWLELCSFCARYYHYPLGQVTTFALPPLLRRGKKPRVPKEKAGNAVLPAPTFAEATPDQATAIAAITQASGFQTFLLHGVTGSGKTEVYLRAIETVLAAGRPGADAGAGNRPDAATRRPGERPLSRRPMSFPPTAAWPMPRGRAAFLAALNGRADIVLGTRLSVFMPMPRLQLIVVDEEHDASFKQQEGLRYSARDVAIFRAKQRDIPIVLGSATPSLETFHHAGSGRYRLLELARCARWPMRHADGRARSIRASEKLQDGLSAELIAAISERLRRGEQSLIFLNRRGYAPVLACPACGWISQLPALRREPRAASRRSPPALPPLRAGSRRFRTPVPTAATSTCSPSDAARSASKRSWSSCSLRRASCASTAIRPIHAEEMACPAGHHPCRRGRHPRRHADARQGPRLSHADAGRRGRRRRRPVRRRLPRAGTAVLATHAGRRPHRPRRAAGRGADPDRIPRRIRSTGR